MASDIHWIAAPLRGKLGIAGKPRLGEALEDQIASWQKDGIHLVVSLLEEKEIAALSLATEGYLCQKYSVGFVSHPVPDRGVPSSVSDTAALVQSLKPPLQNGKAIAIHCRDGIGRSAVIAACVLTSFGVEPKKAFDLIAAARGFKVPDTEAQRNWVAAFAAAEAGRSPA